jgi:hypothetical protein
MPVSYLQFNKALNADIFCYWLAVNLLPEAKFRRIRPSAHASLTLARVKAMFRG